MRARARARAYAPRFLAMEAMQPRRSDDDDDDEDTLAEVVVRHVFFFLPNPAARPSLPVARGHTRHYVFPHSCYLFFFFPRACFNFRNAAARRLESKMRVSSLLYLLFFFSSSASSFSLPPSPTPPSPLPPPSFSLSSSSSLIVTSRPQIYQQIRVRTTRSIVRLREPVETVRRVAPRRSSS